MQLLHWAAVLSLLGYLAASALYVIWLLRPHSKRYAPKARICFLFGLALHSVTAFALGIHDYSRPIRWSGDYYLWLSWLIAALYSFWQARLQYPIVGAFIAPMVALWMASSSYLAHTASGEAPPADFFFLTVHVVPAIVAEASLIFAFVASMVFLLQERRLKAKAKDFAFGGPSLDMLDTVSNRCTLFGFVAMTAAVISGILWSINESRTLLRADYLQWSALGTWVLLALLLHLRLSLRWSRRKLSVLTVATVSLLFTALLYLVISQGNAVHGGL